MTKIYVAICCHQYIYWAHWGWMMHICIGHLTIIGSDNGLTLDQCQAIIWTKFNQCWSIVNWTLRNKLQRNLNQNSYIFNEKDASESVIYKMAAILSQPQCVNSLRPSLSKLSILGSDNGLSPGRRQAIIQTNAGILFIWPFGTNFSEILIEINTFSFKKMHLKMSSGKWRPFVSASIC